MPSRRTLRQAFARAAGIAGAFFGFAGTAFAIIVGTLSPQFDDVLTGGGVVAQGVGLAGREDAVPNTNGSITIAGVPGGATVQRALLYWTISSGTDTTATLNGSAVTGTLRASVGETCWGGSNNNMYRADVTSRVPGNGVYVVAGLPSSTVASAADTSGAALVVVYENKASADVRRIMIRDGGISASGDLQTVSDTFTGVAAPVTTAGNFHLVVGDGQALTLDGDLTFNGITLGTNQFTGSDGSLFDVNTYNISVPANTADLVWTSNNGFDCLSYQAAVLDFGLPQSADLVVTVTDGVSTTVPGAQVTYTIVVTNNGPSAVTDATVVDNFPTQCSVMSTTSAASGNATGNNAGPFAGNINQMLSMPSGSSVTYTSTCTIAANATGTLVNQASASSVAIGDPDSGNNSATDNTALLQSADLAVTVTDGVSTAVPGAQVTYTIVVTNNGPSAVTDSTVVDNFPVQCSSVNTTSAAIGGATGNNAGPFAGNINQALSMPSGSSVTYTSTCTIAANATGGLVNQASASSVAIGDPNSGNNNATDNTALLRTLDIDASTPGTKYDALTDGLLALRHMFGLTGDQLTMNALGATASRTTPAEVGTYMEESGLVFDIDGDGFVDALTDGLLIIRYLFGLTGEQLIANAVTPGAPRDTAMEIETYLQSLTP